MLHICTEAAEKEEEEKAEKAEKKKDGKDSSESSSSSKSKKDDSKSKVIQQYSIETIICRSQYQCAFSNVFSAYKFFF